MMSTHISWDALGTHVVIVLDHAVPADEDVEAALCAYHGVEDARLQWDRSVIELVISHPARRVCAEVAILHLFARGFIRPVLWFGELSAMCR
jgi:hypothetical protein